MIWYKKSQQNYDWAIEETVPPAPGESPIPSGHVRLYHYSNRIGDPHETAISLRTEGIDIGKAVGHTYGEPDVVWASTQKPHRQKVFAEFSMSIDDPRWDLGKPYKETAEEFEKYKSDVTFNGSILPEEIVAVHEPWHYHYRYVAKSDEFRIKAKTGGLDYLMDSEYGPAIAKIKSEPLPVQVAQEPSPDEQGISPVDEF